MSKLKWEKVKLGDVCNKIVDGSHNPPIGISSSDYLMLSSKNIYDGVISYDDPRYLSYNHYKTENERTKVSEGDVLLTIVGTIGRAAVFQGITKNIALQRSVAVLKPNAARILSKFLMYSLISKRSVLEKESRGVAQKGIYLGQIKKIDIPLPPLEVQQKIAKTLDAASELLALRKKQLAELDKLIQSVFYDMFGDPVTNEKGWDTVTINDVCLSIVRGPFGSALKKEFFVKKSDNSYKVYEQKHAIKKNADIGDYFIDEIKYNELIRFSIKPMDIIMSCSGTFGEFYRLPKQCKEGVINQALLKFSLNEKVINYSFFLLFMKKNIQNLEVRGSGIQNLSSVSFIKDFSLSLPPISLQNDFATVVQKIEAQKSLVQKSIGETQMLFDSLMNEYFE